MTIITCMSVNIMKLLLNVKFMPLTGYDPLTILTNLKEGGIGTLMCYRHLNTALTIFQACHGGQFKFTFQQHQLTF